MSFEKTPLKIPSYRDNQQFSLHSSSSPCPVVPEFTCSVISSKSLVWSEQLAKKDIPINVTTTNFTLLIWNSIWIAFQRDMSYPGGIIDLRAHPSGSNNAGLKTFRPAMALCHSSLCMGNVSSAFWKLWATDNGCYDRHLWAWWMLHSRPFFRLSQMHIRYQNHRSIFLIFKSWSTINTPKLR